MKKIVSIVCVLLFCVMGLTACAPKIEDVKKTLTDNGYEIFDSQLKTLALVEGLNEEDLECFLYAWDKNNTVRIYVVGFHEKDKAKEFYLKKSEEKKFNYSVIQKGKFVIYGMSQGVNLFSDEK